MERVLPRQEIPKRRGAYPSPLPTRLRNDAPADISWGVSFCFVSEYLDGELGILPSPRT